MALTLDPAAGTFTAAGGLVTLKVVSTAETKLAFKIKCSNNEYYRVKPVYGFVDSKGSSNLEVLRLTGPPKEDKLQILWAEVPADETDPTGPFRAGAQIADLIIPLKAT